MYVSSTDPMRLVIPISQRAIEDQPFRALK
jgi:hypothetical protein